MEIGLLMWVGAWCLLASPGPVGGQQGLPEGGGLISRDLTLESFVSVRETIIVGRDATLTVKPGATLAFAPGVMLAVNGTLIAKGQPNNRIKFTKERSDQNEPVPEWPSDIRLVDELSVVFGRLQLLYQGKWRGVCANSVNWTVADTTVACQQLGFQWGNFSFNAWARNDTDYLLFHKPECTGNEKNLLECAGNSRIKIGSRICINQQTVHLHCYGLKNDSLAKTNWWGLEFYNATIRMSGSINESSSVLEYVDIEYSGVDPTGQPVPTIRASPTVPHLKSVSIKHCALDAMNYTQVKSSAVFSGTHIENNRGNGILVESHLGHIEITDSLIQNNKGNGVKTKFLNDRYPVYDERLTFCKFSIISGYQNFPQTVVGIPNDGIRNGRYLQCEQKFQTQNKHLITLSVVEMDIEESPYVEGYLDLYEGWDYSWTKLITYKITNGTLPQGITTNRHYLKVIFRYRVPERQQRTRICQYQPDCIRFAFILDSSKEPYSSPELYMNNTNVLNNTQHGINVENIRNYIILNSSVVAHNAYGAGLRVFGGAGDVLVNASRLTHNQDNAINITINGGTRIFNGSRFENNLGNGVNITINETSVDNRTRYAREQITEVSRSHFVLNDGFGVRVGNSCMPGLAVVNDSFFHYNRKDAIEMESCFQIVPPANVTNFTIAYNVFKGNYGHAIKISPMLSVVGIISNNTFKNHPRHTLLIDNTNGFLESLYYTNMKVDYKIFENTFTNNSGFYVANVRLTHLSDQQKLDFKFNRFTGNVIQGAFPTLNERTRAYGVVIISSNNTIFERNRIQNPKSRYEITTHLQDKSNPMEAKCQWWGTADYYALTDKVFDQYSRFNLPEINYYPILQFDDLYNTPCTNIGMPPREEKFDRGDKIGGRLTKTFRSQPGRTYTVDRDINIVGLRANGKLQLEPGTVLEVENAIGILVEGELQAQGTAELPIIIRLKNSTTYHNNSHVRLVDGFNDLEGRLEVNPNGTSEWGTVCEQGWNMIDASTVCQMMGMVIHPDDWRVPHPLATPGGSWQPIWRSNVECTELDMDVTECEADGRYDHSCSHEQDVWVRCKPPTWAGIRFLAKAIRSKLAYTEITQAGLVDPTAIKYAPAIRIDYNSHTLEHLKVTKNVHDGIEIMRNDVYFNVKITHSIISYNEGNGVSTRGTYLELYNCTLEGNKRAGFEYNPHYTTEEAMLIRTSIHEPEVFNSDRTLQLSGWDQRKFVITERWSGSASYQMVIEVQSVDFVVVDLLDYNPETHQENVTFYEGKSVKPNTRQWRLEEDLPDFPIYAQSRFITLKWDVHGSSSGRLAFVVYAHRGDGNIDNDYPWPELRIKNSTSFGNEHGVITRHYNQPSNEYKDLFFRFRWELIQVFGVHFHQNRFEALHVPSITKYHELYVPTYEELQKPFKVSEITYEIEACLFTENGAGVLGEHNHVEFSNNVWIWQVSNNRFEQNKGGGFSIELPKVNLMYTELYNHSVDVNDTVFERNLMFEFLLEGFYFNSSVARNRFHQNVCKGGCFTITGTEKDLELHDNEFTENQGKYMVELNMNSHTPYTTWVDARVENNNFKRNRKPDNCGPSGPTSSPTSYTFGVKGIQNITMNRNLFSNYLDFELLSGFSSSALENWLDVRENWWGNKDESEIKKKIFDFDDWNRYAIADFIPYLLGDNFQAPLSPDRGSLPPEFDPNIPLGGRIETDVRLYKRSTPYVVKSDLTIMPKASMFIEKGVELQFYPNIGILVLGSLTARGTDEEKIKFGPIPNSQYQRNAGCNSRFKRQLSPTHAVPDKLNKTIQVRLSGGDSPGSGFLEMFNETENRWTVVCDNHFNEKTAEVACRAMGLETSNAIVRRSRYYDFFVFGYPKMHEQLIEWFWRRTMICDGTEAGFESCRYKLNLNLHQCMERQNYVYIRCGARTLASQYDYWGNIRFSTPEYEDKNQSPGSSHLEYVDVYGAGILHGEKAAAIQSTHRAPNMLNIRITHCNSNGYDYIAPKDEFDILHNYIQNNNGYAFGCLVLNGESDYERPQSSFVPLIESTIPYDVYGVVRMCTTEKLIYVVNRLLVYYKYDFETIDCVKIVRSREPHKRVAVRFLQFNLYNDSFYENAVEMYNGEYFEPEMMIKKLVVKSSLSEIRNKYETFEEFDTMGIRVTASAAYGDHGFIAEVVTIPISPTYAPNLGPGMKQRVANSVITNNEDGGFRIRSVGEINPAVIIELNQIQRNGLKLLNFTSSAVLSAFIQNSRLHTLANNYIVGNAGGVMINTTTTSRSNSIYSNITNNVLNYNTHGETLHIEGHYFQGFDVRNNYIAYNNVGDRNVIAMFGIALNFTTNIVYNNSAGFCILNSSVPKQIDINQRYMSNSFWQNEAYGSNRSTIFLRSAKSIFQNNYLVNSRNIFEMVTFNRTKFHDGTYPEVVATENWWGFGTSTFVNGRIWGRLDDDNLIKVLSAPYYKTNTTILQGKCYPGWRLNVHFKKCYWYFGGVLPFHAAELECKANHARLAWARDMRWERYLGEIVASSQENYDEFWESWVYSEWQKEGYCTVLKNYKIDHRECDAVLPFVCERDPYVEPVVYWYPIHVILAVSGSMFILILIFITFGFLKSCLRSKQRIKRRTDLRRSIRGSRATLMSHDSLANALNQPTFSRSTEDLSRGGRRRPAPSTSGSHAHKGWLDLSGVTMDDTYTDSMDKPPLDFHRPATPASILDSDQSYAKGFDSSYHDSDLGPNPQRQGPFDYRPPRLENEIPHMSKPSFEQTYRNDVYDDSSLERSHMGAASLGLLAGQRGAQGGSTSGGRATPLAAYMPENRDRSTMGSSSSGLLQKPPRPRPKETDM